MSHKKRFLLAVVIASLLSFNGINRANSQQSKGNHTINIGSDRELFIDDYVVDQILGKANLRLHHPVPQNVAIEHDAPWEGNSCVYHTVFKDGDIYRMYYRGSGLGFTDNKGLKQMHKYTICYAESKDGINWVKPNLGLFEFEGSKANNIVLTGGKVGDFELKLNDNATIFKDENPNVPSDALYKAFVSQQGAPGLLAFKSPDGIHFTPLQSSPVIRDGAFDSQNVGFWDTKQNMYRAYWRVGERGVRAIRTASSTDFLNWGVQTNLKYVDSPDEHLYTGQVKPYHRAPQLILGFPARYVDLGWSKAMKALPGLEHREAASITSERHGTAITETLLMASRDGITFKRWNEAFMRPGIQRPGTWNYGHHYTAWGLLETKSDLPGAPNELSIYSTEDYWTGVKSDKLRRYTLRLDGFVSVNAPMTGGELITKPLTFTGNNLSLNFSTSAAGEILVELLDINNKPIQGYSLNDCETILGDTIEGIVNWKSGSDVSSLAGKPVRIRFVMKDADLYSFQFIK